MTLVTQVAGEEVHTAGSTGARVPRFSIIIRVKGRLEHLRHILPAACGQADADVFVVDYDCPDGTSAWVQTNHRIKERHRGECPSAPGSPGKGSRAGGPRGGNGGSRGDRNVGSRR